MPFSIDPDKVRRAEERFLTSAASPVGEGHGQSRSRSAEDIPLVKLDPYERECETLGSYEAGYGTDKDLERDSSCAPGYDGGGFGSGPKLPGYDSPAMPSSGLRGFSSQRRKERKEETERIIPETERSMPAYDPYPEPVEEESVPAWENADVRRKGMVGFVRAYDELKPESVPGGLSRWFTSLFSGAPFCRGRAGFHFVLQPDEYSDRGARQVVMYGIVQSGFLSNGSKVIVQGRTSGNGSILAHRIDVITDEESIPTRVAMKSQMSALSVWLCTLLLIGLAYCAVQIAITVFNGIMRNLGLIILILIAVGWLWMRTRRRRRSRWRRW